MQNINGFVSPLKKYNNSVHAWEKVQYHLRGMWHNANVSLDIVALHQEIQGLQEANH